MVVKELLRDDEPHAVEAHKGAFDGGRALIVLGGPSGANWKELHDKMKPDVLITVNNVGTQIPDADYWICAENMNWAHKESVSNKYKMRKQARSLMHMFLNSRAKVRLVNRKSHYLLSDKNNTIKIKRSHIEVDMLPRLDFREYSEGLMNGPRMQRPDIIKDLRVGTVGLQALHFAAILGCVPIATIGFDLCFRDRHHWYDYPMTYTQDGRFWLKDPATRAFGLDTTYFWTDTLDFLVALEPYLERQGIKWSDYSDGLLAAAGMKCATRA